MTVLSTNQIREKFLKFFESRGHKIVHSSSLVPANDPTLLFTNAGMVQFKDVFTGLETRDYKRATTSQKCVRAGGKHNDLENVGYTARHHTFFEMLGNFSFGDYFKHDAIKNAWDLVTQEFGLPAEKLYVTVYHEDDEAFNIWHEVVGLPKEKIIRIGDKKGKGKYESDNFWAMGDTGPCGPCSEIFYDHGDHVWGGLPGSPEEDGDRYIEIWNLVFMQFERSADGSMKPLPKPSIDTGMGLERVAAVLQGVHSNYEIDIFQHLIKSASEATGCTDLNNPSLKVIADHIRATVFLMVDGVLPSNEGRGYVLRRIMRRAIRHGYKLGQKSAFFHRLVPALVKEMGEAYPEIIEAQERITQAIKREEERFAITLEGGMNILQEALTANPNNIAGEVIFKLYDTYGFPVDLTADIAREKNISLDLDGYEKLMAEQKARAKASGKFTAQTKLNVSGKTAFLGYEKSASDAEIIAIYQGENAVSQLNEGQEGILILNQTPFYAESGGQVGDRGLIQTTDGIFEVLDTQKQGDTFLHFGRVQAGEMVLTHASAQIDEARRASITRHHSVTHLLHKALRDTLGSHVQQKGALNDVSKTRFDFAHDNPLTAEEISAVESAINAQILANSAVITKVMSYDEAKTTGAMALFGEKYGDTVRVVFMGENHYSIELCGGTHVKQLGEIGLAKITGQSAVSAGIRRVEIVTGLEALKQWRDQEALLNHSANLLKVAPEALPQRIETLQTQLKNQEKEMVQLKKSLATGGSASELQVENIKGWKVLALRKDDLDNAILRDTADQLRDKYEADLVVLASADGETARLIVSVKKDEKALHAGNIIKALAVYIDGNGGGRPDFAQAGGKNPAGLGQALKALPDVLNNK